MKWKLLLSQAIQLPPWKPDEQHDLQGFATFLSLLALSLVTLEICQHLLKNRYVTWSLIHVKEAHETGVKAIMSA